MKKSENCCEHGDHRAPPGKIFCSIGCYLCDCNSVSAEGCDGICTVYRRLERAERSLELRRRELCKYVQEFRHRLGEAPVQNTIENLVGRMGEANYARLKASLAVKRMERTRGIEEAE